MKFRKTKLTALAMSVLMAASTITSVTWAADLFTDGAPAEAAVEAPVEVVSDVEEEVVADDAALTGISIEDVKSVTFQWDKDSTDAVVGSKVVAVIEFNGTTPAMTIDARQCPEINDGVKAGTCIDPAHAIYAVQLDGMTFYSTEDDNYDQIDVIIKDECEYDGKAGYIIPSKSAKDAAKGHKKGIGTYIIAATHEKPGKRVYYNMCTVCGQMLPDDYAEGQLSDYSSLKPSEVFANAENYGAEVGKKVTSGPYTFTCDVEEIDKTAHNYDEQNPHIVYTVEYVENEYGMRVPQLVDCKYLDDSDWKVEAYGEYVDIYDFMPVNCYMYKGEMVADPAGQGLVDPTKDSYYFYVVECKDCHTIKFSKKVYLKNTEGEISGTYYEHVLDGNILGFFGKDKTKSYLYNQKGLYTDPATGKELPGIPAELVSDPPEPIFKECGKMGYYDMTEYVTDVAGEPVSKTRVPVEGNHSWGALEVVPGGIALINDVNTSKTEDGKLLKDSSEKVVVVRDAKGNVTEAKSANCVTTAKYQLGYHCLKCGLWKKEGDLKTAGPNKDVHDWGVWSNFTDPADDKYYDLGDGTHKRYTYKHRTCRLCGARDLKLNEEFTEAHNLVETKYDDEGEDETYVAPTCGKPGSYDVILRCKCGYEDKESRKTTTIPATDKHVFSDPAELQIIGEIQVGGRTPGGDPGEVESSKATHIVYAQVVRKCTVCGEYDSNGIDNTPVNGTGNVIGTPLPAVGGTVIVDTVREGRTFSDYVPAKVDPSTNVPYPCSVGKITVNFTWEGKVDGEAKRLTGSKTVPYYINELAYQGARAHKADDVRIIDKVEATATQEGSYTRVVYCSVCHDEVSREKVTVAKLGSAPAVTAKAVDYNTVDISWDAVEGASEYKLYYKSADTNVTKWQAVGVVKGTSFTHTGLQTGARYRYTVRGVVDGVLGAYDKNGDVARPMPVAPVMKSVTAQGKKTVVSWSKVEGATGYIVFRRTPAGSWTRVGTVKSKKTSWTDKKPVSGSTYKVRSYRTVKGVNYKSGFSDVK